MLSNACAYSFFDHTADIGIRAQGKTLGELFVAMAQGVTELIAEDSALEVKQTRLIELSAERGWGSGLAVIHLNVAMQDLTLEFVTLEFARIRCKT